MKHNSVLSKNEYIAVSQLGRYTDGPEIKTKTKKETQSLQRHLTTKIIDKPSEYTAHCN